MCCPSGSRVIYSTGSKIILVLLTVHAFMNRLRKQNIAERLIKIETLLTLISSKPEVTVQVAACDHC